ncbi:carbohydrate ABC transporter permease [Breznakiella homolactica]|uniref:Carbohydrate ABC transporter permease n=1 Tax=Breznakiella homolactica TaxID=2798577 RepID=A0A7T7XPK6_9SPIR|nr:carbohydrate ABC transporter permease [Breznakiella homolactica]QQO10107.1 carbohydrate ABC transporter permease [Breznakiella homolactica]
MKIRRVKKYIGTFFSLAALAVVAVITCYPFLMMIMGSFKEDYEIFTMNPSFFPRDGFNLKFYRKLLAEWPFIRNLLNSVIVTASVTAIGCFFCTLAGFTFAKYRFPFKNGLFLVMLSSMMIPSISLIVPTYLVVRGMGGLNQYWSLILPGSIPAFGIFMIRQFAVSGVPDESLEYARVEGASEWKILMKIAFPMLSPAIFSLAILTFMNTWNDFLWPIIITTKKEMLTVTALLRSIGDASLAGGFGVLLAATTLSTIPMIVLYLLFHKKLIQGILDGMGKE